MLRRPIIRSLFAIFCIVFLAAHASAMIASARVASDPVVETDVIGRLNAWRITEGLAPMQLNAELQALALKQAQYLVGLTDLPQGGDMHLDDRGKLPPERASLVNWPSYGKAARTAIGENAAVGNAKFALQYWLQSEIHRKTALNPTYREVGVAAIPYFKHYLIIAVFGARPDYLPAFLFPEEGTLYFTNEQYKWKSGGAWMQNVTHIELYDENGKALLPDPIPFSTKIKLPALTTQNFEVVYRGGKNTVRYKANINSDVAILPREQQPTKGSLVVAVPTTVASANPANVAAQPTSMPRARVVYPTNTPRFNPPPSSTPAPAAQPTESPLKIINTEYTPEIIVMYDRYALIIVNNTGKFADISDLKIRYQGKILEAKRWASIAPMSLEQFPAGHCLMLETSDSKPFIPLACKSVRAVIWVPIDRIFWRQAGFDLLRGSEKVAACPVLETNATDACKATWR
jgi:hypothetical protein